MHPTAGPPVQQCHRCGLRVPQAGPPRTWCPRCAGVLSAPSRTVPRVRWVATPPPTPTPPRRVRPPLGPTPRYAVVPRWGLPDRAPGQASTDLPPPSPVERVVGTAQVLQVLLLTVVVTAAVGALAEAFRYVLALRGRTELLGAGEVAFSDATVLTTGLLTPVFAVAAAVVAARWLVRAQAVTARARGLRETRRPLLTVLGVLVPLVSAVLPGVWLAELEQRLDPGSSPHADPAGRPTPSRLLRAWWATFVLSQLLALAQVAVRVWGHSVQAQANSIVLAVVTDVVAAVCAGLTLALLRRLTAALGGPAAGGRTPRRWVASVPTPRADDTGRAPAEDPAGPSDTTADTPADPAPRPVAAGSR